MVALLLVAVLAAPSADTLTRVPGTSLRFGLPEERVELMGAFPRATVPDAGKLVARKGPVHFFGIDAEATLYFDRDALTRVKIVAEAVSEHSLDYVEDELRRLRLTPEYSTRDGVNRVCDWLGGSRVHVEMKPGHLEAKLEPGRNIWIEAAASAPESSATGLHPGAIPTGAAPPSLPSPSASPTDSSRLHAPIVTAPAQPSSTLPSPPAAIAVPPNIARALGDTLDFTRPESVTGKPKPELLMTCTPAWPKGARASGVQGRVVVRVLVDTSGRVAGATIARGIDVFNASALDCARATRFKAYRVDDRAVMFWTEVPVLYVLHPIPGVEKVRSNR
jgi:protein TonB